MAGRIDEGRALPAVPTFQVLAVDRLVIGDPRRVHRHSDGGVAMAEDRAIHGGEQDGAGRLRRDGDGLIADGGRDQPGGERRQPIGRQLRVIAEDVVDARLSGDPRLGLGPQVTSTLDLAQIEQRMDDLLARLDIRQRRAGDVAPPDRVHQRAAIHERRIGGVDPRPQLVPFGGSQRPGRAIQQVDHQGGAEQHVAAIAAGIGQVVVLDERAVGVEAVTRGDVLEGRRHGAAGRFKLSRVARGDGVQGHDMRAPHRVGGRARVRTMGEAVDGGDQASGQSGTFGLQLRLHQQDQIGDGGGDADLPLPPIAHPLDADAVAAGLQPGQGLNQVGL